MLAKTRSAYLIDFIYLNEIEGSGFKNGISGEDPIYEATAYALEILDFYGKEAHDITDLESYLEDELENMFGNDEVLLYDLFFLLKSLNVLEYSIDLDLKDKIYGYINDTEQIGGGFSFSNTSALASLSSTYFIVQIHSLIEEPVPNISIHTDWILKCNNSDGGYGGNSSLSSTYLTTYYAVSLLEQFESELVNESNTLNYLNAFYIDNPSDEDNVGGFLPLITAKYTLLTSTYYIVKAISIIDESMLNNDQTIKWVLSRQYFQDGGFSDISEGSDQLSSAVISSYYAFETLRIFNPSLSLLSGEVFMVEFNYLILVIIMAIIGIISFAGVVIWRRRRI